MDKIETRADAIDWPDMRHTVDAKIRYLEATWRATEEEFPPEAHEKMVQDMYFPIICKVARFCECLTVGDEAEPQSNADA